MHRLGLLALALPTAAAAQPAPAAPIRAWMGVHGAFLTDFGSAGAAGDYRFMIERLGGPSAGVMLGSVGKGSDERDTGSGAIGYAALLGGKSFELGDAAFVNASLGVGYGQGTLDRCAPSTPYFSCESDDARGLIVPARLEVHVASSSRASFGASVSAVLTSPIGSLVGVGLHANFGRNLRGDR